MILTYHRRFLRRRAGPGSMPRRQPTQPGIEPHTGNKRSSPYKRDTSSPENAKRNEIDHHEYTRRLSVAYNLWNG